MLKSLYEKCAFKSLFKYEINIKHNKFLFFLIKKGKQTFALLSAKSYSSHY